MVIANGVLPIDEAVFYTCQLADAIQHASDRGIVHRDIKPSNVLIGEEDTIKLVDMGLARSDNFELSEDMTASGVTLGTFDYISPEQARDPRDADLRSDIYSLGCTLYFMLSGRPPYPGGTMLQKLLSHGNSPPPDARLLRDEVSDDLNAVLERMLAKSPEDRYQSVADLMADLQEVAIRENLTRTLGIGGMAVQPPHPLRLWAAKHLPWVAAASLLLFGAITLQLFALVTGNDMKVDQPVTATIVDPQAQQIYSARNRNDVNTDAQGQDELNPTDTPDNENAAGSNVGSSDSSRDDASLPPKMLGTFPVPPELTGSPTSSFPETSTQPFPIDEETSVSENAPDVEKSQAVAIELIRVVGPQRSASESENPATLETRSLASAFELAGKHGVDLIEIATDQIYSAPLVVTRDSLQVRSTVGATTIIFETPVSQSTGSVELIMAGQNRVEFEKINFVWRVPASTGNGGALFSLNENKRVRLNECTVTIQNPFNQNNIFAFDVRTRQTAGTLADDLTNEPEPFDGLPLVSIGLNDVVVRGAIGLMRLDQAVELQLRWENGLLAISETAIETGGSSIEPPPGTDGIRLSLNDVTAFVPQGLIKMNLARQDAHPVRIDRDARRSLFVVDPGAPHLHVSGLPVIDETTSISDLVLVSGESNAYHTKPGETSSLVQLDDWQETQSQIQLEDVIEFPRDWFLERAPRLRVRWSDPNFAKINSPRDKISPDEMTPADFAQDGELGSGFLIDRLPEMPVLSTESL